MMFEFLKKLCESNGQVVHPFETSIEGVSAQLAVPNEGNSNQEYYFIIESECVNDVFLDELLEKHAEELMDKLELGVGYSLHVWKGLCFCPNYTLSLREDEAGEREGSFNMSVSYKF